MSRPNDSHKKWLGSLTDRYHEALDERTLSYLANRGIDRDAATGFRLGLVSDPDPMHEPFLGRLSIPFLTPTGVVYMRFRCLEDHDCKEADCKKYLGPDGEKPTLYNVQALHDAHEFVAVCEGELDALVASSCGIPAVGVPGATSYRSYWTRLFDDFETVYLLGDGDNAGRQMVSQLQGLISGAVPKVMPTGHDVSSYVLESGADAFRDYVVG